MSYFRYPLKFTAITTYFSSSHRALDFGWNNSYGGKNCPVYAIADSKVIEVGYNDETGYRVWLQTDDGNTRWLHRYIHLQKKPSLKVGQKVKKGAKIGNMGNTGNSYGNHLHFDLWKCPKGYSMNWADRAKYAVNPTSYLYIHKGQVKSSVAGNKKGVKDVPVEFYTIGKYRGLYKMNIRKEPSITSPVKYKYVKGSTYNITKIVKDKAGRIWGKTSIGYVCIKGIAIKYCKKI